MNSITPTRRAFFGLIGIGAALAPFAKAIASAGPEAASVTDLKITSLNIASTGVTISGTTTLDDWREGTNSTRVDGGPIAANSVKVGRLVIGPRS